MNVNNSLEEEIVIRSQKGAIHSSSYVYWKVAGVQALVLLIYLRDEVGPLGD